MRDLSPTRTPDFAALRLRSGNLPGGTLMRTILATTLAMLAASPLCAETLDELYAKAKPEGALSIYGGGPARLYEGWIKEFEDTFLQKAEQMGTAEKAT